MFIFNHTKICAVLMFFVFSFLFVIVGETSAKESLNNQLVEASNMGNLEQVKSLIKQGADINFKSNAGITALMKASQGGDLEIVKLLIKSGADIHIKNKRGQTALTWTAGFGRLEVAKFLIKSGADVKDYSAYMALQFAIFDKNTKYVKLLVDGGVDVNTIPDDESFTPLMKASQKGYFDIVKILVSAGADVNVKDKYGQTALILTASWPTGFDRLDIVKLLIEAGADVNIKNNYGYTALMRESSDYANMHIIRYLVKSGADIHAKANDNETALMIAAENGQLAVVSFLISKGADINAKNKEGMTALTLAQKKINSVDEYELEYYYDLPRVIEYLKKKGAK